MTTTDRHPVADAPAAASRRARRRRLHTPSLVPGRAVDGDEPVRAGGSVDEFLRGHGYAPGHYADDERHHMSVAATLPFVRGTQPFHWNELVERLTLAQRAVPQGGTVLRQLHLRQAIVELVEGDGWTMYAFWAKGSAFFSVSARTVEVLDAVRAELRSWAPERSATGRAGITFTYRGGDGVVRSWRAVQTQAWADSQRNYPAAARSELDGLVTMTPATKPDGRLVLFHGPPGTGKSTLVRTLAHAWRDWCDLEVVVDPDRLFADPGYLFETVLSGDRDDENENDENENGETDENGDGDGPGAPRWRMFVLEDCGELLRADALERNGQALGRLLNVADGVVGQGLRVIVCLTTNEDLRVLHPAVVRPGRCLAAVEIGRFPADEARRWLADAGVPEPRVTGERSLADLVAMAAGRGEPTASGGDPPGMYL